MSFWRYLKDHLAIVVAYALAILTGLGLLALFDIDPTFLFYVGSILFWFGLLGFIFDYLPRRSYYQRLSQLRDDITDPLQLPQLISSSSLYEADALQRTLERFALHQQAEVQAAKERSKEYRDYLELWIHEVKNPLASAGMALANQPNPKVNRELDRIESYLDQALYYARASSLEKDYLIQHLTLHQVVDRLLMKRAEVLIDHRFKIEREGLDLAVKSDPKWLLFILEQLIDNAIKYSSSEPVLRFEGKSHSDAIELIIEDNGIGISAKDLPRLFDKGYTGEHGRSFERSTGLGLYLCRLLAEKMGLSLSIQSQEHEFTRVTIRFPLSSLTQM